MKFVPSLRARASIMVVVALALTFVGLLGEGSASAGPGQLQPISKLDVARYLGVWNQVAAIPQPFNVDCLSSTQAKYSKIDDRNIRVENTCIRNNGSRNRIVGNARVNDLKTLAQLHVSFPGVPFQGSKSGPTNYVVTYIAPDYSWALVGDPNRLSGFVLKRTPDVSKKQWDSIKKVISARGYNTCFFLVTPVRGKGTPAPLCTR
ncbi:lipocalin family protein [Gordonia sp. CPCC 205333]|uniref:lipocalin family protein n=1 Tax=Gordonia sp. CPCC 205333 TaxID=3140790 RepID=UPI003AF3C1C0